MAMNKNEQYKMARLEREVTELREQLALHDGQLPESSVSVVYFDHAKGGEHIFYLTERARIRFRFDEHRAIEVDYGVRQQEGERPYLHIRGLHGQVLVMPRASNYFNVDVEP